MRTEATKIPRRPYVSPFPQHEAEDLLADGVDMIPLTALEREAVARAMGDPEHWRPSIIGGSPRVAGLLGMLAESALRAGHRDTAYWYARWAAAEGLAFFLRMDNRCAAPYEIHDPVNYACREIL